jgi:transposase-like protein
MFDAKKKADTVRRHLQDMVPVSELAAELDIQPTLIHQWINQVLTQGSETGGGSTAPPSQTTSRLAASCFSHDLRLKPNGRRGG